MIIRKEIQQIAKELNVPSTTIDKDWVLGHLVNAIYSHDLFKNLLVFKGGTCLRKTYFKNYRFSEDLDFTSLDKNLNITKSSIESLLQFAHS